MNAIFTIELITLHFSKIRLKFGISQLKISKCCFNIEEKPKQEQIENEQFTMQTEEKQRSQGTEDNECNIKYKYKI